MQSYARFYPIFFQRLEQLPAFSSRAEAEKGLRDLWVSIHEQAGASRHRIEIMQSAKICAEQGWKDVEKTVCYLDSPEFPPLRIYVHNNGTVIVQQLFTEMREIVFSKPGKVKNLAAQM